HECRRCRVRSRERTGAAGDCDVGDEIELCTRSEPFIAAKTLLSPAFDEHRGARQRCRFRDPFARKHASLTLRIFHGAPHLNGAAQDCLTVSIYGTLAFWL